ncbi:MAG: OmpA family protein, partial [Sphingobacteriaceae bacterium]
MKQNLLKTAVLAIGTFFLGSAAMAQDTMPSNAQMFRTWSVGVNGGVMSPVNPFGGQNDFSNWKTSIGYGVYVKKQFTNYFSLRLDGYGGKLKGDNLSAYNSGVVNNSPVSTFETDVNYAATLS